MSARKGLRIAIYNPIISGRGGAETIITGVISELQAGPNEFRLYIFGGTQDKAWLRDVKWWVEIGQPSYPRPLRLAAYIAGAIYHTLRWRPDVIVAGDPTTVRLAKLVRRFTGLHKVPIFSWLFCSALQLQQYDQLSNAEAHLCMCQERADEMLQFAAHSKLAVNGYKPVHVVYCGTPNTRKPPLARSKTLVFLFVGRIHFDSQKRTNDLIAAAAKLRGEFQIKLLGDGPEEDKRKIRELIKKRSWRTGWSGWVGTTIHGLPRRRHR